MPLLNPSQARTPPSRMKINSLIIRNKFAGLNMFASGRQAFSIFTDFSSTACFGLSFAPRGNSEIFVAMSMPSTTSPKMVCLLSSQGVGCHGDEKLAAIGSGAGIGHRKFSRFVVPQFLVKFVGETVSGIAGSSSERASALNHELRYHAMKNEAVVKRALGFLPGLGIFEFLGALRKAHEIRNRLRGFLLKQANDDRTLRCIEHCIGSGCAAQGYLQWKGKCAGIITHSGRGGQRGETEKRRPQIYRKRPLCAGVLNFRPLRLHRGVRLANPIAGRERIT